MTTAPTPPARPVDLTLKHPHYALTLGDAFTIALNAINLGESSPRVLESLALSEVKQVIERSLRNCGHVWITGEVCMDLIRAAESGKPVKSTI